MLSRPTERGSTSVALAFAVFLALMTVVTVYIFWAKVWWFPPAITDLGHEIDAQYARTFLITGIVFVAAQLGLAYAIFKFRDHGQKAIYFEGNNTMEIAWTLATVVLFVCPERLGGSALHRRRARCAPNRGHWSAIRLEFPLRRPGRKIWPGKTGTGQRVDRQSCGTRSDRPDLKG